VGHSAAPGPGGRSRRRFYRMAATAALWLDRRGIA
jgi:hypothetical protein